MACTLAAVPRLASIEHAGSGAAPPSDPVSVNIRFVAPKPQAPTIDVVPHVVSPEAAKLEERLELARDELARLKAFENG